MDGCCAAAATAARSINRHIPMSVLHYKKWNKRRRAKGDFISFKVLLIGNGGGGYCNIFNDWWMDHRHLMQVKKGMYPSTPIIMIKKSRETTMMMMMATGRRHRWRNSRGGGGGGGGGGGNDEWLSAVHCVVRPAPHCTTLRYSKVYSTSFPFFPLLWWWWENQ